jgi:hypothetical protein
LADTGIDCDHPDIALIDHSKSVDKFGNRPNGCWQPGDTNETHATHVAGTILGRNNSTGIYGVAYNADLYHARVLGPNGGTVSQVMAGVQWLADQHVKVVNLSLGGGRSSRTEENFYNKIRSKGILVVAASGNDGARSVSYPAAYSANIAVGAVDRNDVIASFSNTGRNLDVVAPGVGILSSVPDGTGSEASVTAGSGNYQAFGMEFAAHTNTLGTTGILVNCGLAISVSDCPAGAPTGFIALVQRGTNSFAEKTSNVMAARAGAAIIYNNVPGDFQGTLGSASPSVGAVWIPVVSISQANGAALLPAVSTSATVLNLASSWDTYDGTSMATPHVTGTIALMY